MSTCDVYCAIDHTSSQRGFSNDPWPTQFEVSVALDLGCMVQSKHVPLSRPVVTYSLDVPLRIQEAIHEYPSAGQWFPRENHYFSLFPGCAQEAHHNVSYDVYVVLTQ